MEFVPFLKPRLTGARFEGHAIPLEFLADLAVLQEMVVDIAKRKFLDSNPGRQRTPRGFADGISMALTSVDDGSASPVIQLVLSGAFLFAKAQPYFEEARDLIVNVIGAAEHGAALPEFPEKSLSYFDRFGRSLRNGEAIEFNRTNQPTPARLTKETRRKLVLGASGVTEVTEDIALYGVIPEADQAKMTFTIQLSDGKRIAAPLPKDHFEIIVEAFNGYKAGLRIRLQGLGKFNRNERLLSISSIEYVNVLEALDIGARLDELKYLKDGWLDGGGRTFASQGLDWLASAFAGFYSDDLPLPHLYPTADAQVRAEWTVGPHELSLEIELDSHSGIWHEWNSTTDQEKAQSLNLGSETDWKWLDERIHTLSGNSP